MHIVGKAFNLNDIGAQKHGNYRRSASISIIYSVFMHLLSQLFKSHQADVWQTLFSSLDTNQSPLCSSDACAFALSTGLIGMSRGKASASRLHGLLWQ